MTDLERGSYPDERLSTELLNGWSVCRESLWKPDSEDDSGDSESGPNGDDKGLGSPKKEDQRAAPDVTSSRCRRRIPSHESSLE